MSGEVQGCSHSGAFEGWVPSGGGSIPIPDSLHSPPTSFNSIFTLFPSFSTWPEQTDPTPECLLPLSTTTSSHCHQVPGDAAAATSSATTPRTWQPNILMKLPSSHSQPPPSCLPVRNLSPLWACAECSPVRLLSSHSQPRLSRRPLHRVLVA